MSDLRKAAQQALAALKGYRRELNDTQPCDAEQALRAALEAQLEQPQEPTTIWVVCSGAPDGSLIPEFAAPWREAAHEHINDAMDRGDEDASTWVVRQFHSRPQPLRSLSDDEIIELSDPYGRFEFGYLYGPLRLAFARAIEAKIKEQPK